MINLISNGFNGVVKARYGYTVYNKNDIYVGKAIEKYGEYSEHEVFLFRKLCREGDVVLDIGANIGTHTLALSGIVGCRGRVIAFEPQRIVFQTLCANMALNSIENVDCKQLVIGASRGYAEIPEQDYSVEGNYGGVRANRSGRGERIKRVTLDDCLYWIDRLNFIKIDVEGMESDVIEGARHLIKSHKPIIYMENDQIEKSKNLLELIKSFGYKPYWHTPPLFNKNNFACDTENIYPNIVSVNMLCMPPNFKGRVRGLSEAVDNNFHPFRGKHGSY